MPGCNLPKMGGGAQVKSGVQVVVKNYRGLWRVVDSCVGP